MLSVVYERTRDLIGYEWHLIIMHELINPVQHAIYGLAGVKTGGRLTKCLGIEHLAFGTQYRVWLLISDSGEDDTPYKKPFIAKITMPVDWTDFKILREELRSLMRNWAD